jgi:hypothetical protein
VGYRLTGQDLETARSHGAISAPGQLMWIYDRPVDRAGLDAFHAALCRGRLGRVAAPALLGAAGDRWTARAEFAPITYQDDPVDVADLQHWFAAQTRAELHIYGGPTWRLSVTALTDGGSAVSLVATHSISDGRALLAAVGEAITDTGPAQRYAADGYGRTRLLLADIGAAVPNLLLAAAAWASAQAVALRGLVFDRAPAEPVTQTAPAPADPDRPAKTNRVTICVPASRWNAIAKSGGGTSRTLAVAVVAGVATELGWVDDDGLVNMDLPVSVRTPANDHMANAISVVSFAVDAGERGTLDLAALRATMKQALESAATTAAGDRRLWRLLPAIPRARWLRLVTAAIAQSSNACRTNCSMMGRVDNLIGRVDGTDAAMVTAGLAAEDDYVATHGGILRADMIEVNDQVTVRISACQPANPTDAAQLAAVVTEICERYGLPARHW